MFSLYKKSSLHKKNSLRKPTETEDTLIRALIAKADNDYGRTIILESYSVQAMDDGEMGSLYIIPDCLEKKSCRKDGPMVAEIKATDSDNTEVVVSLFLDSDIPDIIS